MSDVDTIQSDSGGRYVLQSQPGELEVLEADSFPEDNDGIPGTANVRYRPNVLTL